MSRWLGLGTVACVVAALHGATGTTPSVGDPHARMSTFAPSACAGCHAEIVDEWATSLHARAWSDEIFQAEYATGRDASCRSCHSPSEDGVDCRTCHVRDGAVVAFADDGDETAEAEACGVCHQFTFPADTQRYVATDLLQRTLDEWRGSRAAKNGRSCVACHMPRQSGDSARRSHRLLGLGDREFLARAVRVEIDATRRGRSIDVHAELRAGDLGHAFPTGDVFRRARLVVEAGSASAEAVLARELGYAFTDDGTDMRMRELADTRLQSDEVRRLTLSLDDVGAHELRWRLVIDRLDPETAMSRGLPPSSVTHVVTEGTIGGR